MYYICPVLSNKKPPAVSGLFLLFIKTKLGDAPYFFRLRIDTIHSGWYINNMKVKTSITLSDEVLEAIDLHIGEYRSRSEFLETAARKFIAQSARKEAEQRDLEIINRRADSLNAEAEDVLTYQVPL